MALFGRKKIERPKSPLGSALYQYDDIIKKDLKKVIDRISAKGKLNPGKVNVVIESAISKFDAILDDLSRENLKIDYRSDKIRYLIIDMIGKLKTFLNEAKTYDYDPLKIGKDEKSPGISEVMNIREIIKRKMKDIESDYI
jgi:hypothetical protein